MEALSPHERLILDLDFADMDFAITLIKKFSWYINSTMINSATIYSKVSGVLSSSREDLYQRLSEVWNLKKVIGQKLFLDLKLNGCPSDVEKLAKDISRLNPKMFSVSALAGKESIRKAVANRGKSRVFGSLETCLDRNEYFSLFGTSSDAISLRCARMLVDAGADGIMCSCQDACVIRQHDQFSELLIACPATIASKPEGPGINPRELIGMGIDFLIVGKPIITDPAEIMGLEECFQIITKEIALGLNDRKYFREKQHVTQG